MTALCPTHFDVSIYMLTYVSLVSILITTTVVVVLLYICTSLALPPLLLDTVIHIQDPIVLPVASQNHNYPPVLSPVYHQLERRKAAFKDVACVLFYVFGGHMDSVSRGMRHGFALRKEARGDRSRGGRGRE